MDENDWFFKNEQNRGCHRKSLTDTDDAGCNAVVDVVNDVYLIVVYVD
jgi:hypothetical protein